jgi:hypothetical protein
VTKIDGKMARSSGALADNDRKVTFLQAARVLNC